MLRKIRDNKKIISRVIYVVLLVICVYVLYTNLSTLTEAVVRIKDANFIFILLAIAMCIATFLFSALASLGSLPESLPYREELLIQVATSFTNRILPSGIGGIALQSRYLYKAGLSAIETGVAVAVRTISAVVASLLLLSASLIYLARTDFFSRTSIPHQDMIFYAVVGVTTILLISLLFEKIRSRLTSYLKEGYIGLKKISQPKKLFYLIVGSFGTPITYGLSLYFSLKAFGISIPIPAAYTAFELASVAGTATPSPGGIGGFEAALTGTITLFGVEAGLALAAALLFRVITFWLTTIAGMWAFRLVQKQGLV